MIVETTTGTVQAEGGEELTISVQRFPITQARATELFDRGKEQGDWGWKHQMWTCHTDELDELLAAIGFFYGLFLDGERQNVKTTSIGLGMVVVEAWYGC